MASAPRIYLDACALIRLFDEENQARVRAEALAVEEFFVRAFLGTVKWVVSEVLETEILDNPYSGQRPEVSKLLASASERIVLTDETFLRAEDIERLGYGTFDALHLACCEQAGVDL